MGIDGIYHASGVNNRSLKNALKYMMYGTLELLYLERYLGVCPKALCSLGNACYSHRVSCILCPPMGVTRSSAELPEMALNIICILLKNSFTLLRRIYV